MSEVILTIFEENWAGKTMTIAIQIAAIVEARQNIKRVLGLTRISVELDNHLYAITMLMRGLDGVGENIVFFEKTIGMLAEELRSFWALVAELPDDVRKGRLSMQFYVVDSTLSTFIREIDELIFDIENKGE